MRARDHAKSLPKFREMRITDPDAAARNGIGAAKPYQDLGAAGTDALELGQLDLLRNAADRFKVETGKGDARLHDNATPRWRRRWRRQDGR